MKHKIKLNYFIALLVIVFVALPIGKINAQQNDTLSKPSTETTTEKKEPIKKTDGNSVEEGEDSIFEISEPTVRIISICFFLIMLVLIVLFFVHIKARKQYLGFQSIKFIGLVLMFPGICILALVGGSSLISGSTLAALLGTIAGYVLSREGDDDGSHRATLKLTNENEELKASEELLKKEITALKEKIERS